VVGAVVVEAVAAGPEAAEVEVEVVLPGAPERVERAEVVEPEGVAGALAAAAQEAVGPEGAVGQPAVGAAEVEKEALPQSGPEVMRGLPETPRLADAWRPREHSPSAGRHLSLSSG
jgi:hypothetical protein